MNYDEKQTQTETYDPDSQVAVREQTSKETYTGGASGNPASGVLGGGLNARMLFWGAVAGVFFVVMDETLGALKRMRLPPLAIGIGVYLGMATILPVSIGAILGWLYDKWADQRGPGAEFARRMGVLVATGMIVGESLWGVAFAGIVYGTGNDSPLALPFIGGAFEPWALIGGFVLFVAATWWLYATTRRTVARTPAVPEASTEETPAAFR